MNTSELNPFKRVLKFVTEDLRDVHTIRERLDGSIEHMIFDRIMHRQDWIDNDHDLCRELLDTDPQTYHYA